MGAIRFWPWRRIAGCRTVIVLFTDFGYAGPYVGQMKAVLTRGAPGVPLVDLMHDAPAFRPEPAGCLLAAAGDGFPPGTVFLGVVDPGVGSERLGLVLQAGESWLVGPDNGLLSPLAERLGPVRAWSLPVPLGASPSFHGRDVFAPAAAGIAALGRLPEGCRPLTDWQGRDGPGERCEVIYVDGYGNAMTGLRAGSLDPAQRLRVAGRELRGARTFSEVASGEAFWYPNSLGLAEVAVNRGSAAACLGLGVGSPVQVVS